MSFRITILCDNTVGPVLGTLGEHGFAALVEWPGGSLLFDTGQGSTLLHNAARMGRDLERVPRVALSHGHYDHAGGLLPLLQACGPKEVLAHPAVFSRRWRKRDTGEAVAIGIPQDEEELQRAGARFDLSREFRSIGPDLFLTGEVPRVTPFETGDHGLFTDPEGAAPDTFADDQSLVLRSPRGLVLLLGCCHAGLINTLTHVVGHSGTDEVYAVIGGTHLGFSSPVQLEETVKALRRFRVRKLCPSHCTGFNAATRLMGEFPQGFHQAAVGYTLEV
jgi:7,8-dihydropterin-6-yl-methyl-4-(beta-D-ribofuranosyl)aminobenzene 5'-phosphate synthase